MRLPAQPKIHPWHKYILWIVYIRDISPKEDNAKLNTHKHKEKNKTVIKCGSNVFQAWVSYLDNTQNVLANDKRN